MVRTSTKYGTLHKVEPLVCKTCLTSHILEPNPHPLDPAAAELFCPLKTSSGFRNSPKGLDKVTRAAGELEVGGRRLGPEPLIKKDSPVSKAPAKLQTRVSRARSPSRDSPHRGHGTQAHAGAGPRGEGRGCDSSGPAPRGEAAPKTEPSEGLSPPRRRMRAAERLGSLPGHRSLLPPRLPCILASLPLSSPAGC